MNRKALMIVIALATAVLLVPTSAVPFGTDTVDEDLVMAPAEGPNGDYAILNEDEEIELLLTGANPSIDGDGLDTNAITPVSRVFTITYTGGETAEVWLTDDSEDVRFYRGDDADDSLEGSDNSVTLEPSESLAVGLLVDTRGNHDVESAETFTVHAEESGTGDGDDGDTDGAGDSDDSDDDDTSDEDDTDDAGNEDDDTRVETPTPDTPAETDEEASPSIGQGETDGTSTPTETVESGGGAPPVNEGGQSPGNGGGSSSDASGGPIGLGSIGIGSLLTIAAIMIALPSGFAAYRWYS